MWAVCQIAPSKRGYKVDTEVGRVLSDPLSRLLIAPLQGDEGTTESQW